MQTILKHELYAEGLLAIFDIALRGFIIYNLFACWKICAQQTSRVFFLTGTPPKSFKYKKVNLG